MAVNILGGRLKGLSLRVPKGDVVRPTSVLLRRRMFDSHQDFTGEIFIDACAGTGAVGFEAWSRGAQKVILIEPNRSIFNYIKQNISAIGSRFKDDINERPIECNSSDIEKWFDRFLTMYSGLCEEEQENTIFFFDPPYELIELYEKILFEKFSGDWYKGEIWIESDTQKGKKPEFWIRDKIKEIKLFKQGTTYLLRTYLC
ncbi:MAG: RsmD family RNA methyltransferase [Bacteriovoracaceae bacterium]|nr:RsmD family RNA methyltransferase [Bacteriovoracaceae bacterium]